MTTKTRLSVGIALNNSDKIILHLCADIGTDSKPYEDNGYKVIRVGQKERIENFRPEDRSQFVGSWEPKKVYGIICNPLCTHFSIARHKSAKTKRDLMEGMRLVKECQRIIWWYASQVEGNNIKSDLQFWSIENPSTGALKYFLGNPTFEYCPHEYGAPFTKRTALWGYFNIPKKPWWGINKPKGQSLAKNVITKMNCLDDNERMNKRSECYYPFAQAFFEANQ